MGETIMQGLMAPENNGEYLIDKSSNDAEINEDHPILIDFEPIETLSPIDIAKYLKCFSAIPDEGSTCSIEIFSDIPVDDHPDLFFNWNTGSPGHTFLQIKKSIR